MRRWASSHRAARAASGCASTSATSIPRLRSRRGGPSDGRFVMATTSPAAFVPIHVPFARLSRGATILAAPGHRVGGSNARS